MFDWLALNILRPIRDSSESGRQWLTSTTNVEGIQYVLVSVALATDYTDKKCWKSRRRLHAQDGTSFVLIGNVQDDLEKCENKKKEILYEWNFSLSYSFHLHTIGDVLQNMNDIACFVGLRAWTILDLVRIYICGVNGLQINV